MNINTSKRKNSKTKVARRIAKRISDQIVREKIFVYKYRNLVGSKVLITTGSLKGENRKVLYMKKDLLFLDTENPRIKTNKRTKKETPIHDKVHISNIKVLNLIDNKEIYQTVNRFIKSSKNRNENR